IGDGSGGAQFASVLSQHGYDYTFAQRNEGHSWGQWRGLIDNMLIELVGPTPVLDADFTEDGVVNAADHTLWRAGAGKAAGATRLDGDADGDRDVDGADFLLWQRQLGATADAAALAVPEPASGTIIGCCCAVGVAKKLAKRRAMRAR
ncbi:MAG: hypothetical protein H0T51_16360, partial [Pirellulales bacterium]|nr:hypothetical protein [Pirellulales bacterium]